MHLPGSDHQSIDSQVKAGALGVAGQELLLRLPGHDYNMSGISDAIRKSTYKANLIQVSGRAVSPHQELHPLETAAILCSAARADQLWPSGRQQTCALQAQGSIYG